MDGQSNKHSLYIEIYDKLKQDIIAGKYPPGTMLPTEMELAEMFYVSRITVQKAMQLLRKDGFISRTAGRGTFVEEIPTRPKQNTIGLILCNVAYSFGLRILTSVERTAAKHGYHVIFKNSVDDPQEETKAINDLVSLGVNGIIIQPIHNEYYNESLIRHHFNKFPIVLVDRYFSGFAIPGISTNNFDAAFQAASYLFKKGHKHIAMFSSPQHNTSSVQERIDGFTSAHLMQNIPINETNFLNTLMSPHNGNEETIYRKDIESIKNFLCSNNEISAIISSEFTVTKLVFEAIKELKKTVPEDYSLIMFDEYESVTSPLVTHICQDQEEIGRLAMETLLAKITNKVVSNKIYVPFKIVEGDTVKSFKQ